MVTTTQPTVAGRTTPAVGTRVRHLLTGAALAGPFFYTSSIVQALGRPGFDIRIHPLSQLATGALGWIQVVSFVLAGLGGIALAIAHRRVVTTGPGSRVAPVFLALFGAGFIIAGLFPADAQNGFPIGAPEGPVALSWHAIVHSGAAALSFTALAGACIALFVRSIRRRRLWASVGHGLVALVLLLPMSPAYPSIQIALVGLTAFAWTTGCAVRLRREV